MEFIAARDTACERHRSALSKLACNPVAEGQSGTEGRADHDPRACGADASDLVGHLGKGLLCHAGDSGQPARGRGLLERVQVLDAQLGAQRLDALGAESADPREVGVARRNGGAERIERLAAAGGQHLFEVGGDALSDALERGHGSPCNQRRDGLFHASDEPRCVLIGLHTKGVRVGQRQQLSDVVEQRCEVDVVHGLTTARGLRLLVSAPCRCRPQWASLALPRKGSRGSRPLPRLRGGRHGRCNMR